MADLEQTWRSGLVDRIAKIAPSIADPAAVAEQLHASARLTHYFHGSKSDEEVLAILREHLKPAPAPEPSIDDKFKQHLRSVGLEHLQGAAKLDAFDRWKKQVGITVEPAPALKVLEEMALKGVDPRTASAADRARLQAAGGEVPAVRVTDIEQRQILLEKRRILADELAKAHRLSRTGGISDQDNKPAGPEATKWRARERVNMLRQEIAFIDRELR